MGHCSCRLLWGGDAKWGIFFTFELKTSRSLIWCGIRSFGIYDSSSLILQMSVVFLCNYLPSLQIYNICDSALLSAVRVLFRLSIFLVCSNASSESLKYELATRLYTLILDSPTQALVGHPNPPNDTLCTGLCAGAEFISIHVIAIVGFMSCPWEFWQRYNRRRDP